MPLNSSGPISIGGSTTGQSINLEFGRTATQQTSMSQLYRGGAIVPDATANSSVPTSGAISLSNFYGATNRVSVTVNITINAGESGGVSSPSFLAQLTKAIEDALVGAGIPVQS